MIQPADQMSTAAGSKVSYRSVLFGLYFCTPYHTKSNDNQEPTSLCVVHPVQDNLGRSVPARHDVTGHFRVSLPRQSKIKYLEQGRRHEHVGMYWVHVHIKTACCNVTIPLAHSLGLWLNFQV